MILVNQIYYNDLEWRNKYKISNNNVFFQNSKIVLYCFESGFIPEVLIIFKTDDGFLLKNYNNVVINFIIDLKYSKIIFILSINISYDSLIKIKVLKYFSIYILKFLESSDFSLKLKLAPSVLM